jgi:two-component system, response regulator, stage 0 sporulation protein F
VREGLARVLERKGYRTRVAEDAEMALRALRGEPFDAVITDIRMPGRDGIDLLREAKELWPDIHFIIMTAYGEIATYLEARSFGAVEYFNKPVRIDDLVAVLTSIRYRQFHKRHGDGELQQDPDEPTPSGSETDPDETPPEEAATDEASGS